MVGHEMCWPRWFRQLCPHCQRLDMVSKASSREGWGYLPRAWEVPSPEDRITQTHLAHLRAIPGAWGHDTLSAPAPCGPAACPRPRLPGKYHAQGVGRVNALGCADELPGASGCYRGQPLIMRSRCSARTQKSAPSAPPLAFSHSSSRRSIPATSCLARRKP
jgi:hypothetical protein